MALTHPQHISGTEAENVIETFDPRDNSLLAVVPDRTPAEVRAAVGAGPRRVRRLVRPVLQGSAPDHLLEVRNRLLDRAEQLVGIICGETGKQPAEAVTTELMAVCETIDYYAKHGAAALRPQRCRRGRWPTRRRGSSTSRWA